MTRATLGVLLVETEDGQVSVQLFAEADKAKEIFRQLSGPGRLRATFVVLDWEGRKVSAESKSVPEDLAGERPEGWRLGEGPIFSVAPFGIQHGG